MTQINTELIPALKKSMDIDLADTISYEQLKEKLSHQVNHLILNDFQKLVSVLYRIDVSEAKLKYLLKENPGEDAGKIIADLIIERQLQKIKSRQDFRRGSNIKDDDQW
jgi:hypothetical protein